jgi:hypothetical protein
LRLNDEEAQMANLAGPKEIATWIDGKVANDGWTRDQAVEHLRSLVIVPGQLRHWRQVTAWLEAEERTGRIARDTAEHEFMRRQTVAAEQSAAAARESALWAKLSMVIALGALVATAWPYFKLIEALQRFLK